MTNKVFWSNPYLSSLKTKVASVTGNQLTLEDTIFYAFSGGQASDIGTINGNDVLSAEKNEMDIIYTVEGHDFSVGDEVEITIDFDHRYKVMRLHFAAEIILELMYQHFEYPDKLGANITSEKARLDFAWDGNISELFPELEEAFNKIIDEDHVIEVGFDDISSEKRYWKIQGFSKVPCGGTHVRSTKEVGYVRLKRVNPGKGKERIEIYLKEDYR